MLKRILIFVLFFSAFTVWGAFLYSKLSEEDNSGGTVLKVQEGGELDWSVPLDSADTAGLKNFADDVLCYDTLDNVLRWVLPCSCIYIGRNEPLREWIIGGNNCNPQELDSDVIGEHFYFVPAYKFKKVPVIMGIALLPSDDGTVLCYDTLINEDRRIVSCSCIYVGGDDLIKEWTIGGNNCNSQELKPDVIILGDGSLERTIDSIKIRSSGVIVQDGGGFLLMIYLSSMSDIEFMKFLQRVERGNYTDWERCNFEKEFDVMFLSKDTVLPIL